MTPREIADELAVEARASGVAPTLEAVRERYQVDDRKARQLLVLLAARWVPSVVLTCAIDPPRAVPSPGGREREGSRTPGSAQLDSVPEVTETAVPGIVHRDIKPVSHPPRADGETDSGAAAVQPISPPRRAKNPKAPPGDLEPLDGTVRQLLTRGLGIDPSPGQTLILDVADGAPLAGPVTDGVQTIERGGAVLRTRERLGVPARQICLVAGIRGGKTTLAACAAVAGALRADLTSLRETEQAAGLIVAPHADSAAETFRVLRELVEGYAPLRALIVGQPKASSLTLRRPQDGRAVELRVVAAGKGGLTLRSRWLTSCVLDEGAFFESSSTAAVTDRAQLDAVRHRVVPGAPIWLISSPYATKGLLYDVWRETAPGWAVIHAPSSALNPRYWTPERVERALRDDYDSASREVEAQFVDGATTLYSAASVERATRRPVPDPVPGQRYVAAIDPASRVNPWTAVVATRDTAGWSVVGAREWVPRGEDLDPNVLLAELAAWLRPYAVTTVLTDQFGYGPTRALAAQHGLALVLRTTTERSKVDSHAWLKKRLEAGDVSLPDDAELRGDLGDVVRVYAGGGRARIEYQRRGPRHADYVPALTLALHELSGAAPPVARTVDDEDDEDLPGLRPRRTVTPAAPWASR